MKRKREENEEREKERGGTLRFDHGELGDGKGAAMADFLWRENSTIEERGNGRK